MTATYTFDVFSSLDGFGSHRGNWGAYWGKQGPELLDHRLSLYSAEQRVARRASRADQDVMAIHGLRANAAERHAIGKSGYNSGGEPGGGCANPVMQVTAARAGPFAWRRPATEGATAWVKSPTGPG